MVNRSWQEYVENQNLVVFIPIIIVSYQVNIKADLVTALLEQRFQIAGSYEIVHKEVEKLKTIMIKNAYPKPFLDKAIKYFLDKKSNIKLVCDAANKYKARITLPYPGKASEILWTQLKELSKKM